jgi:rRNA maturation RNase YbeY
MITFHIENISFKLSNCQKLKTWIKQVAADEGKTLGDVNYIFCGDDYLLSINKTYLNHDYFTDVITFDYSERLVISGDVFISVDTVRTNAQEYNVPFEDELCRVMIHGILHLCGYKDFSKKEKIAMREREDLYLAKIQSWFS